MTDDIHDCLAVALTVAKTAADMARVANSIRCSADALVRQFLQENLGGAMTHRVAAPIIERYRMAAQIGRLTLGGLRDARSALEASMRKSNNHALVSQSRLLLDALEPLEAGIVEAQDQSTRILESIADTRRLPASAATDVLDALWARLGLAR